MPDQFFLESNMDNSYVTSRQHGLTLWQWGLLIVAFMVGLCGSLIVREIFLPVYLHAGTVQTSQVNTAPVNLDSAR